VSWATALGPSNALALSRAQVALAYSGWELKSVEIDQVNARARIEVSRAGRHVILDVRQGAASVSRESWDVEQTTVGRRGDRSVVDRVVPRFLGRERFDDVRSALRYFADYVDGNGNGRLVGREAFQLLLGH
jgi:hypothetical protein